MHSIEYTTALLPGTELTAKVRPCILVIRGQLDRPGEEDVPRQTVLINKPLMLLGRDSTCTIRIQDRFVSRFHAALTRLESEDLITYWLRDGDGRDKLSANGVFVNGKRLVAPYQLRDRDQIRFGTRLMTSFHEVRDPLPSDHQQHEPLIHQLLEASLITSDQLESAQAEQAFCKMLLGEVMALRGWVQPETIEFLLQEQDLSELLSSSQQPIGEYLKAAGLVTEAQVIEALRYQKRKKVFFGAALVEKGYLKEETLNFFLRNFSNTQDIPFEEESFLKDRPTSEDTDSGAKS